MNTEHTPHQKEIELTKDQEHMRLYMLKKGHIIMLNQPLTANTNKIYLSNISSYR